MPRTLAKAFRTLCKTPRCHALYSNPDQFLLFSAKNTARFMTPDDLADRICDRWSAALTPITSKKTLSVVLGNTSVRSLAKAGMDDDEIRYLCGRAQETTSGKHYCDFIAAVEQLHMSHVMDRWVDNLVTARNTAPFCEKVRLQRDGQTLHVPAASGCRIRVKVVLTIDSQVGRDLALRVAAKRGLRDVDAVHKAS